MRSDRDRFKEAGVEAAKSSIAAGQLALRVHGYPPPWLDSYATLLKSKLGVRLQQYGCMVEEGMLEESHAFNSVMRDEIARRFGRHAIDQIRKQAELATAESTQSVPDESA